MMSNQSEAPKESSCQDWSAPAASTLAADQSDRSASRAGETQEQPSVGVHQQSLAVMPNPSPALASAPVAIATASLAQQPMSHLQLVSQMVSGANTQSAQVSMQQSQQQQQQSIQIGSLSQPPQQTYHHLTTAQGAMHQTIQYGVAPSMMTQGADQQSVHQQTTQAVMAHGAGQPTIQLGMGQSLLAHGVGQQTIQGLVAQGGSMFGGAQIICSSDPSNNAQMDSGTMTCPQYLTSSGLSGPQFMPVPQLQVIQAGPNQFIPQQFMYQNMAMPAVHAVQQNQSGGQQMTQGRSNSTDSKTPNILPAGQQLSQIRIALTNSYTLPSQTAATKGMATVVPQQATVFGGKQVTQKQQSSSLVFGVQQQPTILQSVRSAGSGSISFSPVQQAQIISNPIRFATGPNFIGNNGQIIGTNQTLLNLGQFQMLSGMQTVPIVQPLIASQGTTILGSQPLYIRTADTLQPQQQGILGNVQTVTQTRHVANIAPQTYRPAASTQSRRGVQVQPNNASATHSQTNTSSSKSTNSLATPKSSAKLPTLAKIPTSLAKPTPPPTSSVAVAPRPPSQSGVLPRVIATSTPVATVTAQSKPQMSSCKSEQPNKAEDKSTPPAPKPDETPPVVAEKVPPANSTLKEEMSSPSAKSVAAVLPTAVEKPAAAGEVKANVAEEVKTKVGDEKKAVDVKSLTEKDGSKVNAKPVREKSQKRMRPKILTHVIEGFIIQEAMEPFPVNRSSLMSQFLSPSLSLPDEKTIISIASQFQADSEEEEDKEQDDEEEEEDEEEVPAKKPRIEAEIPKETLHVIVPKEEEEVPPAAEKPSAPAAPVETTPSVAGGGPRLTCEFCGKSDLIQNFARSKRFCSVTCSKRFSAYSQRKQSENGGSGKLGFPPMKGLKRPHQTLGISNQAVIPGTISTGSSAGSICHIVPGSVATLLQMTSNSTEYSSDTDRSSSATAVGRQGESSTPCSPPELDRMERMDSDEFGEVQIPADKHLSQWGVQEVYNFIRTLPGCGMYADEFRQQEIDGQALMLLKEDHLMTTLNVKLGPALKICAKINKLKD